jgi:hypothetical protein
MNTPLNPISISISKGTIHSFDGFYKNVRFKNGTLIIPYINLAIVNHELNPGEKLKFINFSYLIFEQVSYLTVYLDKNYVIIDEGETDVKFHAGGTYLDYDTHVYNDNEICCANAILKTVEGSMLSSEMWIPFDTPNLPRNMSADSIGFFKRI